MRLLSGEIDSCTFRECESHFRLIGFMGHYFIGQHGASPSNMPHGRKGLSNPPHPHQNG